MAGVINVIAGGGSFLTIPLLIFLGLPPTTANYTNRICILFQNVGAVWTFNRHGVLDWRFFRRAAVPATLGSLLGAWGALSISDRAFQHLLVGLMVAVTLGTLWKPAHRRRPASPVEHRPLVVSAVFFAAGVYGGFIQAGVGFLLLAATTLAGLDLVRGNAVKVLSALTFTGLSLALFAWRAHVVWPAGISLGLGTLVGGQAGVHLTVLRGHAWTRRVVSATVILCAVALWMRG